jgi:hypothetical protein
MYQLVGTWLVHVALYVQTMYQPVGTCRAICTNHVLILLYIYVDQCTRATRTMYQPVGTWLVHIALYVPTMYQLVGTCRAICTNHVPNGWYIYVDQCTRATRAMYQLVGTWLVHVALYVPTMYQPVGTCRAICTNHVPTGWYMSHYMYQPCTNPLVHLRRPTYKGYTLHVPTGWYMVSTGTKTLRFTYFVIFLACTAYCNAFIDPSTLASDGLTQGKIIQLALVLLFTPSPPPPLQ